jgi:predicted RNA-binding Zn-ribbon protein involved in translation (DUF1610 family)
MKNMYQAFHCEASNNTLHYCGFECPSCGFQHRLSDDSCGEPIVELFRSSTSAHALICPECGSTTSFERKDLRLFASTSDRDT